MPRPNKQDKRLLIRGFAAEGEHALSVRAGAMTISLTKSMCPDYSVRRIGAPARPSRCDTPPNRRETTNLSVELYETLQLRQALQHFVGCLDGFRIDFVGPLSLDHRNELFNHIHV